MNSKSGLGRGRKDNPRLPCIRLRACCSQQLEGALRTRTNLSSCYAVDSEDLRRVELPIKNTDHNVHDDLAKLTKGVALRLL